MKESGFALLVELDRDEPVALENGVYCFGTEDEAVEFAFQTLVAAGEASVSVDHDGPSGEFVLVGDGAAYNFTTKRQAVESWRDCLDSFEYFHFRKLFRSN